MGYNLGDLEISKVVKYQEVLQEQLKDYFLPPEATKVNPIIPLAPMPGGALTANTQMMRDSGNLEMFDRVINAMSEVVSKGGYGTSVTPVSQFYWQQAYANVMFGNWDKITEGFGKMVLGYFGRTPVVPDPEIVEKASEQLKLEPTTKDPLDIADADEKKSIAYWQSVLEKEGIEGSEENIFISAACKEKGIAYLKGESPLMVRKISEEEKKVTTVTKGASVEDNEVESYTVVVDGKKYSVQVAKGSDTIESITPKTVEPIEEEPKSVVKSSDNAVEVLAQVPGTVWKIYKKVGDSIESGETIMMLEVMKMEIEIIAPKSGVVESIEVDLNQNVAEGQLLAKIG